MSDETAQTVARALTASGYDGLFLSGDPRAVEFAWGAGENRAALNDIVAGDAYPELARLLAAEVLRAKDAAAAPPGPVYARALALSGLGAEPATLDANVWGFMYYA